MACRLPAVNVRSLHRVVLVAVAAPLLASSVLASSAEIPAALDVAAFRDLMSSLSEPDARFTPQYLSNEDSLQFVMPELVRRARPGGIYIGVASEQNFTYVAHLRPALAFIVDIRRDNLCQVLLYKALFELSPDRATFVARLFSRVGPEVFDRDASADELFAAFAGKPYDAALHAATRSAVLDNLGVTHGLDLDAEDRAEIERTLEVFRDAGPEHLQALDDSENPTFAELMAATDLVGRQWGFLAAAASYDVVRDLHLKNLIVPVVGDFAGDKALAGIGAFLAERNAVVSVFYVSNVERYLWEDDEVARRFYANLARLPIDDSSLMIRSATSNAGARNDFPIPDQPAKWRTFLHPIRPDLDRVRSGQIASYRDLFVR